MGQEQGGSLAEEGREGGGLYPQPTHSLLLRDKELGTRGRQVAPVNGERMEQVRSGQRQVRESL